MHKESKKLSIAMICDPLGDNKSGVVVSTIRFAKLLKARGHHVIFIVARSKEYTENGVYEGIPIYRFRSIPIPKSCGWNTAFPTTRELKKIFSDEHIDIVHIILPMSSAIAALRAAKSLGLAVVAHSHSQPENLFMDMPSIIRPTLDSLWNRYLAWLYSKAHVLIYPSAMAQSLLTKLERPDQISVVISNGIHTGEFKPMPVGDFHERFNIPEHTTKLLFVGRLFPEKSIDTLLKALPTILAEKPDVHAMIVGGGYLRENLERLVKTLGVEKKVTFLGLVTEEDKILAYNACDVFVLPSLAELEGMVVLEAMACGKPLLIADSPMSASRYFVEDNGFLFTSQDHGHLAEQALRLLADTDAHKKMGEVSLEKSKKYDSMCSTDALEEAYYTALQTNERTLL